MQNQKAQIGVVALKDYNFRKIPLKEFVHVKYHQKLQTLSENSIPLNLFIKKTFPLYNIDVQWPLYPWTQCLPKSHPSLAAGPHGAQHILDAFAHHRCASGRLPLLNVSTNASLSPANWPCTAGRSPPVTGARDAAAVNMLLVVRDPIGETCSAAPAPRPCARTRAPPRQRRGHPVH